MAYYILKFTMKKLKKILLIAATLITGFSAVQAQDVNFSQFYANPLYMNPAFAGAKVAPRISLSYRLQWPKLVSAFSTISASYDQYFPGLHGGIGAIVLSDRQGDHGALKTNMIGVMYSFRFQLADDFFMNAGLQASVNNTNISWDEFLRFPDQIDPTGGFIHNSSAIAPENQSRWYPDFSAGLLAYGSQWYVGFAAAHLNQPDQGFYGESIVPMKFTANAGGLINVSSERRRTSSLGLGTPVISPNFIYQYQMGLDSTYSSASGFHTFNYGLYLDWNPFMVGLWYRQSVENSDALIFMAGVQFDYLRIGYSYDVTVSKLANHVGGSHEITLGFVLPTPERKHKVKAIRCPSF